MWTKQKSLTLSIIMTAILFVLIIAAAFALHHVVRFFTGELYPDYKNFMTALYISVLPGLICTVSLFKLLMNIKNSEIFVNKNVTLLRILSWCCFFVGIEYILFGFKYATTILLAFAALFFGMILRVIKNVFDRAIEICEENDYTI